MSKGTIGARTKTILKREPGESTGGAHMAKVNVGMVGLGEMGRCHVENLARSIPECHLLAVADADLARAKTVAAELGVEHSYPSLEVLLERKDIVAVVIATPDKFHAKAIELAAAAGKHILGSSPYSLYR